MTTYTYIYISHRRNWLNQSVLPPNTCVFSLGTVVGPLPKKTL